jgi:hypothetical protein
MYRRAVAAPGFGGLRLIPMQYFYERKAASRKAATEIFAELDDVEKLARHMSQRSAAMLGSKLELIVDKSRTGVGARYAWRGHVLGLPIAVDEEVTVYHPPLEKRWCTVGRPRLIVLSRYCMSFSLRERVGGTDVTLRLDYDLPQRGWAALAGKLLGRAYARWCVDRMVGDLSSDAGR